MGTQTTRAVLATAAIVLGLGLAGCGSDGGTEATTSEQTTSSSSAAASTSSAAPSTSPQEAGSTMTVGDYLEENGITQVIVKRGDPTAPVLNLPMPPGWMDVGADTPEDAYGAIVLESATGTPNPPAIIARMARQPDVRIGTCRSMAASAAPDTTTSRPQRSPFTHPLSLR